MALAISVDIQGAKRLEDLVPNLRPLLREAQKNTAAKGAVAMERRLKLMASGEAIGKRSGTLADSVGSTPAEPVGGGYEAHAGFREGAVSKYAPIQEFGGTITPKNGKYLWIPLGEALTASGVSRFSGPGDPELEGDDTAFIFPKGRNPLFGRRDENDEFEALFVGVPSVTLPARHPVEKSFNEVAPTMAAIGQEELDSAVVRALGG